MSTTPATMTMLRVSSAGAAVLLMQQYLNRLPTTLQPLKEDGLFGNKTNGRVRELQAASALQQDGIVGPNTWDAILKALGGPAQWAQRFRIIQVADAEARPMDVAAKLPGAVDSLDKVTPKRSFRRGHEKLLKYFRVSSPHPHKPGESAVNEDVIRHLPRAGGLGQLPHWCGIFALYTLKTAGMNVGTWVTGSGISSVTHVKATSAPLPGDVGYVHAPFQHHFIIRWLWPGPGSTVTVDTIEGNSDPTSNFSFKTRDKSAINAFYSAF